MFFLRSWRLEKTSFSPTFVEASIGFILMLCCEVLLGYLTKGSSLTQSAFPFSNTGFFNKLLIILLGFSAKTAPREVFLDYLLKFIIIKNSLKNLLRYSFPSCVSRSFGLGFSVLTI